MDNSGKKGQSCYAQAAIKLKISMNNFTDAGDFIDFKVGFTVRADEANVDMFDWRTVFNVNPPLAAVVVAAELAMNLIFHRSPPWAVFQFDRACILCWRNACKRFLFYP